MKIVLTRSMVSEDIQYIRNGLNQEVPGQYELVIPDEFTENGICAEAADADILLGPYITKKILKTAKNLKLIQVPWTGMDTFDFSAVQGTAVPVCNTHSNAEAVAEMGMAIVLDLLKKVSYHDRKMRNGNWNRNQKPLNLKSKMLSHQTVCILGFGHIGSRIGKLITAFGAKVIAVGGHVTEEIVSEIYSKDQMVKAVGKANVIICTMPLTMETRNIIDDKMFNAMKQNTIFVNLSRAAIVKEDDAWKALKNGKLGAFGSDVWWNPPKRGETQSYPSAKYKFWELENVLLSPHRAGFVEDCLPHLDGAIENIIRLIKGKQPIDTVDIMKGF